MWEVLINDKKGKNFKTHQKCQFIAQETTQFSVMAYMGKESKKQCYMYYITDSLCFTPETNTTL